MTAALLLDAERGNKVALGRLITRIESSAEDALQVMRLLADRTRSGHVIGFFGPPGVGKSTLIGALIPVLRADGATVAVLATDPTSPLTSGAILGDRLRMQSSAADAGVFIRSLASRDAARNLSAVTPAAARLLGSIGYDYVLIETVGGGQADMGTTLIADTNVLVLMPGMGDEVQGMKAGIMELPDIFVLSKADVPDARRSLAVLRHAARSIASDDWTPPVVAVSALSGESIPELVAALRSHRALDRSARDDALRRERSARLLVDLAVARVDAAVRRGVLDDPALERVLDEVLSGKTDLYTAVERLAEAWWMRHSVVEQLPRASAER